MTIAAAIAQSIATNSIVRVEVDDMDAAREEIAAMADYDTDSVEVDGGLDVWGWTDETPENEQDWRLLVVLA